MQKISEENEEERFVHLILEGRGYSVQRIMEAPPAKRADFSASADTEQLLIEVKTIVPPPVDLQNGLAFWDTELGYRNKTSAILRNGGQQLVATPHTAEALRVIWFVLRHVDWEVQAEQVKATAYGSVDLIDLAETPMARPCYLFTFSEFWRSRDLDGIIVGNLESGRLCANPWSKRAQLFRSTTLSSFFEEMDAVSDPFKEEAEGRAFVADVQADRRDETAVLDYVRKKYGRERLIPFRPTMHRGAARLPRP